MGGCVPVGPPESTKVPVENIRYAKARRKRRGMRKSGLEESVSKQHGMVRYLSLEEA